MRSIPPVVLCRSLAWRPVGPCVRERHARYEDGGSVRESRGAVQVGAGAWWSAALVVPMDGGAELTVPVRVRLVRHGAVAVEGPGGGADVELLLPAGELAAVVALLGGVASQAARDGVLPRTAR